jgi:DNA processing protein
MTVAEQAGLVLLLRQAGTSWALVADRVEEAGSSLAVLAADGQGSLFESVGATQERLESVEEEVRSWREEGISMATLLDAEYPSQLLTIHQRPPFVTWRGCQCERDSEGVAVVGTRHPSPRGLHVARSVATGLAEQGVTVVSGLATGIDTAAHLGALDAGGRTVAVIGTGLRRSYPKENQELQLRIGKEGMVLSQFMPDAPPTKQSFPMRNATMSGFSSATVVIEASERSGAKMQARLALEHGRPVFLHESLLENAWARTYSDRPGVSMFSDVGEVIDRLRATRGPADELVWG